jgi:hypothetical protein
MSNWCAMPTCPVGMQHGVCPCYSRDTTKWPQGPANAAKTTAAAQEHSCTGIKLHLHSACACKQIQHSTQVHSNVNGAPPMLQARRRWPQLPQPQVVPQRSMMHSHHVL